MNRGCVTVRYGPYYGQQSGGMHPTGMLFCFLLNLYLIMLLNEKLGSSESNRIEG